MDTESQDQQIDELIAPKYGLSVIAQYLGDDFMKDIVDKAQLRHKPQYFRREKKLRSRIISKIQRYQQENHELTLREAISKVTDLSGGRLVVHFLKDTTNLHKYVCDDVSARDDIKLVGPCDDCIHTPRNTGFRAITQLTSFRISSTEWFPFEIQIMTFLQHDWGEKQHRAYEFPEPIPKSFHASFRRISKQLYVIDQQFESLMPLADTFLPAKDNDK